MQSRFKLLHLLAWLVVTACLAACGAPPKVPIGVAPASYLETPAEPGARWVRTNGEALIGPPVAGGTLVLLGGRRALLDSSGHVEWEKVATPELLQNIASVPTPGGPVLMGIGYEHLYRFDDPLGAGTSVAEFCTQLRQLRAEGWAVDAIALVEGDPARAAFSKDGGATLFDDDTPKELGWVESVVVGEVGALFKSGYQNVGWLRIGWGRTEPTQ